MLAFEDLIAELCADAGLGSDLLHSIGRRAIAPMLVLSLGVINYFRVLLWIRKLRVPNLSAEKPQETVRNGRVPNRRRRVILRAIIQRRRSLNLAALSIVLAIGRMHLA